MIEILKHFTPEAVEVLHLAEIVAGIRNKPVNSVDIVYAAAMRAPESFPESIRERPNALEALRASARTVSYNPKSDANLEKADSGHSFTQLAERILERAADDALSLGRKKAGPADLLLAALHEDKNAGAEILRAHKVVYSDVFRLAKAPPAIHKAGPNSANLRPV